VRSIRTGEPVPPSFATDLGFRLLLPSEEGCVSHVSTVISKGNKMEETYWWRLGKAVRSTARQLGAVAIGRRLHVQISKRTPQDKYTEGSVQGVVEQGDQESQTAD
jgi:hypothetical protein